MEKGNAQSQSPTPTGTERSSSDAYWQAIFSGLVDSRIEADRSIILVSSAGIGFLVTLLTSHGEGNAPRWLYAAAFLTYTLAIAATLLALRLSDRAVREAMRRKPRPVPILKRLDWVSFAAFLAALILTAAVGWWAVASDSATTEDQAMTGKDKQEQIREVVKPGPGDTRKTESLEGLQHLRPDVVQPGPNPSSEGTSQTPANDPKK